MHDYNEIIRALDGLLSIPSVTASGSGDTPYGPEADRALTYMLELCRRLGFRTKNCAHRVGWAEIGAGDEMVAVLVHLDVVPAGEGWDYPPFACTQDNGRLYGRGMADDKGPAIACVYAMKRLLDKGVPLARRIRIIFGLAEEGGDWSDLEYYCQTEEKPVCGFTPDGMFPVIYGEKGFTAYQLSLPLEGSGVEHLEGGHAENMVPDICRAVVDGRTVEAQGRSCHGSKPWEGENAISKLMEQLSGRPVADLYNACIGFDLHGERLGCQVEDDKVGPLTVNVGKVRTVGGRIVFWLDIRYPTVITAREILDRMGRAVAPYGARAELEYDKKPVYLDQEGPLISTLVAAYRRLTGDTLSQPLLMKGGTYAKAMDNIAVYGPLLPGREGTEHQKNEHLSREDFFLILDIYQAALEDLTRVAL